jgi:hypothetical protein
MIIIKKLNHTTCGRRYGKKNKKDQEHPFLG